MDDWLLAIAENGTWWGMPVFILITTVISGLLSSLLGFERERKGQPAGLRTHVLLAVGSSMMMSLGIYGIRATGASFDAARIGAAVISGIGFLCAGCIIKNGASIRGLTTSATLFICGGIGLACGCGYVIEAIIATAVAFLFLIGLIQLEKSMDKKAPAVHIVCDAEYPILTHIHSRADDLSLIVKKIDSDNWVDEQGRKTIDLTITFAYKSHQLAIGEFIESFIGNENIYTVEGNNYAVKEPKVKKNGKATETTVIDVSDQPSDAPAEEVKEETPSQEE